MTVTNLGFLGVTCQLKGRAVIALTERETFMVLAEVVLIWVVVHNFHFLSIILYSLRFLQEVHISFILGHNVVLITKKQLNFDLFKNFIFIPYKCRKLIILEVKG